MDNLSDHGESEQSSNRKQRRTAAVTFTTPEVRSVERPSTLKVRTNLLESGTPTAVFSPVQSSVVSHSAFTESSRVDSSISSTMSTRSEVDKCKELIFRALSMKKNVSRLLDGLPLRYCLSLQQHLPLCLPSRRSCCCCPIRHSEILTLCLGKQATVLR